MQPLKYTAIPLTIFNTDPRTAEEARRYFLRGEYYRVIPDLGPGCSALYRIKFRGRRVTDLEDGSMVRVMFHLDHGSNTRWVTVQLGRCVICGERIDLGKGVTCSPECRAILDKREKAAKVTVTFVDEETAALEDLLGKVDKGALRALLEEMK